MLFLMIIFSLKPGFQYIILSKFQSNKNTAVVEYMPRGEDHEKFLSCRGVNPHLPDLAVEDQWKITVHGKNYIL